LLFQHQEHSLTKQAMNVQRHIVARWCNHRCSGKAMNISHTEYVFVALGIQQAHAPYCHLRLARLYHIFHIISNTARFFRKKKMVIEHDTYFDFLYVSCLAHFSF
jgi:hypothetical protein